LHSSSTGLFGSVDPVKVTILFTWYIVADFAWILVEPTAVPSLPNVILLHHVVTFILLCFPLKYNHLALFTCWDGICEINTFFLIARRQWKTLRRPLSFLYWATFFPLRIFLYPYMLTVFYSSMKQHNHAVWETFTVCACQIVLIGFNLVLLALSIGNWKKRAGGGGSKISKSSPSPGSSPSGAVGKGGKSSPGSSVTVTATRTSQRIRAQAQ
jgi:hypothetical protein